MDKASSDACAALLKAIESGDVHAAELCLGRLPAPQELPVTVAIAVGQLHMSQHRWQEAAVALSCVANPSDDLRRRLVLCRNLADAQVYRPQLLAILRDAPADNRYRLTRSRGGRDTVYFQQPGSAVPTLLSPGGEPDVTPADFHNRFADAFQTELTVALCGMGDGYLLNHLAHHPPKLFLTETQPVFLVEPDAQAVLASMMIHDYSGDAGPIRQSRFYWCVGAGWAGQVRAALRGDVFLAPPQVVVSSGLHANAIKTELVRICDELAEQDAATKRRVEAHYASVDAAQLTRLLQPNPPRQPRVLLVTTRFSTVLQYSTRDAAAAFQRLGFSTEILIEPSDHARLPLPAVRSALDRFRPDVVFQIDHLRHEMRDIFPPGVVFVCWIQDLLSNLMSPSAGSQVGPFDFVMSNVSGMFVEKYGYPRRQMVDANKLTAVDETDAPDILASSDRDDLAYVSNASQDPRELVKKLLRDTQHSPALARMMEHACQTLLGIYARGDCIAVDQDMSRLLRESAAAVGAVVNDPNMWITLLHMISHPLNTALYRQQALGWAAQVCDELGLRLGLYGSGWENHPTLSRHARGPVGYGRPLQQLTAGTAVNLLVEPFACVTHQRLLDGVMSGGFFAVRRHCFNDLFQELSNFLADHADQRAQDVASTRATIDPSKRQSLEDLLRRAAPVGERLDPIDFVRGLERAGAVEPGQCLLPALSDVQFDDATTLRGVIQRFIGDPAARQTVAAQQRDWVSRRFTYTAGLRQVMRRIAARLAEDTAQQHMAIAA